MSTDKLADALAPLYEDSDAYDNRYDVAAWLRSSEGIAALAEDETILEGIAKEANLYTWEEASWGV